MAAVSDICGQMEALGEIMHCCTADVWVCQHTPPELDPFLDSEPVMFLKHRCVAIQ